MRLASMPTLMSLDSEWCVTLLQADRTQHLVHAHRFICCKHLQFDCFKAHRDCKKARIRFESLCCDDVCSKRVRPLSSWELQSPYVHPRRYNRPALARPTQTRQRHPYQWRPSALTRQLQQQAAWQCRERSPRMWTSLQESV